jgi:MFS family permease
LAGVAKLAGGALVDDPHRRRSIAVGGYTTTAVLSAAIGAAVSVWQVGILRAGAWAARALRVPARNALLADVVPASAYGRAYGFERAMDNLGAIVGSLLALSLVAAVGVRWAIVLSIVPGLLAAVAIVYAVRRHLRPSDASGCRSGCGYGRCCVASLAGCSARSPRSRSAASPPPCSSSARLNC